VLAAVAARGWRVPEDLTLMLVLSSSRVAEMFHPRLTTLEPPSAELGRLGARMLIDRLEGGPQREGGPPLEGGPQAGGPQQRLVPCRLVIGDSSAPPRPYDGGHDPEQGEPPHGGGSPNDFQNGSA
jgi:DNA-binding LacI/PurR family transcriptional regulator